MPLKMYGSQSLKAVATLRLGLPDQLMKIFMPPKCYQNGGNKKIEIEMPNQPLARVLGIVDFRN
jgi:hypothetical protein